MSQQLSWKFDGFFVWIYSRNKEIIGAGFLIGGKDIVTCAHVVRDAFGLKDTPTSAPQADALLSFPSPEQDKDAQYLLATASVYGWDQEKDIAILRLNDELPKGARPAKLYSGKVENHPFTVYGFPGGTDKGVSAYGVIKDKREHGLVQLESEILIGYEVQGGFSGGPVFDNTLNRVVGMIATSDKSVRVASMIPVDMLASVCSRAGVFLEFDKEEASRAMNISSREICENCLKASFSERDKQDFISLCMNHIPAAGRLLDDMRSIDWMINITLNYCGSQNDFEALWRIVEKSRPNQYKKFYPEWQKAVSANRR